ncbi:squalene epoxidase-domain-containing protein [Lyophyllum atratum]|nr:squalene epoxidase-domain-containing protein [Lyophyllum atratum]
MPKADYDVLIVGAGIAGSSLAHALSTLPQSKPLRIALLERSLAEPDRIVGELLQPGGVIALKKLGLQACLEGIDAIPVRGYCVVEDGKSVHIPYPGDHEGRSFHHGRFIMTLRAAAKRAKGVDVIEAAVTDLIEDEKTGRVIGVRAARKDTEKEAFYAKLVVIADGCFSNFRTAVMGEVGAKSVTKSHFVGAVLEDARLPIPNHGTVALIRGFGPVLLYQISEHDTRMLVDVKVPLPSDLKAHILTNIVPQLPSALHLPIQAALDKDRIRRMPNSFLPAVEQGSKEGVILLGDSWNMRHPLTGGGMTVALNDVVMLRTMLGSIPDLADSSAVKRVLHQWHWSRKPLSSTINILSVALYDLFGADDELLAVLRTGCFKYFECGGECINGPVSLLSGIIPSPLLLANHFFSVAFYSIWVMFTHPQPTRPLDGGKPVYTVARIYEYPALFLKALRVFWTACVVFGPLLWSEIRWWAPADTRRRNSVLLTAAVPLLAVMGGMVWTWRMM